MRFAPVDLASADLPALVASCEIDHTVGPVVDTVGGSTAGYSRWSAFLRRIRSYGKTRNHPLRNGVSRMSAYLHYGMVAPPRLAREAAAVGGPGPDKYLDELIVWRELANHWCAHHEVHQSLEALPEWAQDTLAAHASDRREERFDREALARGRTGDDLWDACQRSLLRHGELHNNLRMTWGKAIPQWVATPGEAVDALFEFNDRYALDGRDPSSVGGLMWCLGLMDRPFSPEIPVLGEIRPRPLDHHARRLDVSAYAAHVDERGVAASGRRVAVVGAGLAGAMCARTLHDHGLRVTLFDKGRGAGGRLSTRRTDTAAFDHGAPGFSIRDRRVGRYARAWRERGLLARWQGPFGTLGPDGFEEGDWGPRFVGVPGMSQVVKHLLADLDVHFGIRVERLLRAEAGDGWQVVPEGGAPLGPFDHVVVAVPAPQAVPLLAAGAPELAAPLRSVEVAPCWSVLMEGLGDGPPWSAAKVDDGPLSFVARNHSKPGRGDTDAWVVHGSPAWSAAHLEDDAEAVAEALVGALRSLVDLPPPTVAMAHRWRYAKVTKPVGEPCLWDPEAGVGVCGDALLGGRVEAALLSGMALAGRVLGAVVEDRRAE